LQLECELCGAHYKADIADAHVDGGRLTFTCKNCGREVVVIGGPRDGSPRAGALVPDVSDGPFDAGPGPDEGTAGGEGDAFPLPAATAEAAGVLPATDPPPPAVEGDTASSREERPAERAIQGPPASGDAPPSPEPPPRAVATTVPEPSFATPEKRGSGLLLAAAGLVVCVVGGGVVFLGPMLTGGKDERPPEPEARPASPTPVRAAAAVPSPPPSAAVAPTPEPAPVVEVRELKPAEARPTPVPTPKKETVRDARSVFEAGAIEEALIRARPLYRLCAVGETKRNPDSKLGTVAATLTIAPSGSVTKVSLDRADLASSPLGQCVRDALAKLTFPAFEGAPAVLRQTIDLEVQTAR
jgi:hypothetical protein